MVHGRAYVLDAGGGVCEVAGRAAALDLVERVEGEGDEPSRASLSA
ncbi:hypothetical protein [Streptomyces sp. NBC_01275]|nr:hypothetical protein [Streptomyces sp. NBC_01275]